MAFRDPPKATPAFLAEDRRPSARAGIIVVTVVSSLVVLLRIYSRAWLMRNFGRDDALICVAAILNIAVMALSIMALENGAGRHFDALDTPDLVLLLKWLVSAQLTHTITLWVCRISGLAFYARLAPIGHFVWLLWVSLAFVTAVFIAQLLILALQCIPLKALWSDSEGTCMGSRMVFISTGAMTVICDAIILLLPLGIVMKIKASIARKISLGIVLCFGLFAVVTSIFRVHAVIPAVTDPDMTWYFSIVLIWSDAEISVAIIALSLPALKGLFTLVFEGDTRHSTSNPSGSQAIGMKPFGSGRSRQRIYDSHDDCDKTVKVECGSNPSEEAFLHEPERITVKETVRVYSSSRS